MAGDITRSPGRPGVPRALSRPPARPVIRRAAFRPVPVPRRGAATPSRCLGQKHNPATSPDGAAPGKGAGAGPGLAQLGKEARSRLGARLQDRWGRLLYSYFNWRQDTWNDLQLFVLLNLVLLGLGAGARNVVAELWEPASDVGLAGAWRNVYEVLVVVFGQQMPDAAASVAVQLFSLVVAAVGFASFALVLALVEQVVLQVLDANVRQGGRVYESGHVLVLSLGEGQRDQEVIFKILSQVCLAYRGEPGGRCAVVLCGREKLAMEAEFRRVIPPERRHGTRFVFRQGLALVPDDLRQAAASQAAATIVISDSSRSPEEADAQAVRVAVLLDELDFPGFDAFDPRTGHIIVEVKTPGAQELIAFSCSRRVIALPTSQLNATRIARMVCNPVVGMVSQQLWSFSSESQGYLQPTDGMQGRRLSEAHRRFPTGLVLGVFNRRSGQTLLNPPASRRIAPGDLLVMMRPTAVAPGAYQPLPEPVPVDLGGWDPSGYVQRSVDEAPVSVAGSRDEGELRQAGFAGRAGVCGRPAPNASSQQTGLYMLPLEYTFSSDEPERVLICGWGSSNFMVDLIRALDEELPRGSEVTLFNLRVTDDVVAAVKAEAELRSIGLVGVRGDPLKAPQLARRLDVTAYKCAIVLCDQSWLDPDLDPSNGIELKSQADMLRLDALVMAVQLNIRKLLESAGFPDINIVTEKLAFEGVTRFEDRQRLPMGICVNLTAYAAKLCFQMAFNPEMLAPYSAFGSATELLVQDAGALAAEGEALTFWQMQARCLAVGQTLIGYYEIPATIDRPLSLVTNPHERAAPAVWNAGDCRRKLITLADKAPKRRGGQLPAGGGILKGSGADVQGGARKREVGHIVLANGGRLSGRQRAAAGGGGGGGGGGLAWVPQARDPGQRARGLKRAASAREEQRAWGFASTDDEHSRLLDELASKEDHRSRSLSAGSGGGRP